jgi:hypothetical protein
MRGEPPAFADPCDSGLPCSCTAGGTKARVSADRHLEAATVAMTTMTDSPTASAAPSASPASIDVDRTLERLALQANTPHRGREIPARRYVLHTLANAPRLVREGNAGALAGLATGLPAVIVAAGPSLDATVAELTSVRDRAVIIACDTAAQPLLCRGLDPDLVVGADATIANARHLSSTGPTHSWLVGEGSLHASAFTHFHGRTFAFKVANHQPWPWLESVGLARATLETWGSVVTSALSLTLMMGCDPIAFVGTDFAFTGGRPYCRGTAIESHWSSAIAGGSTYDAIWRAEVDRWPAVTATDVAGQPVRTAAHLVAFRDWIVERTAASRSRRFVNATRMGLLHGPGIQQAALPALLAGAAPVDRGALGARLRRAHHASSGDLGRLLAGVSSVLADPAHEARGQWTSFAGSTLTDTAVDAALRSPVYEAWTIGRARAAAK